MKSYSRRRGAAVSAMALLGLGLLVAGPLHAAPPAGQFVVSADGLTVQDSRTGLVWQRVVPAGVYSRRDAIEICRSLNLGGQGGFRLPTVAELQSIVDERRINPAIDPSAFPSVRGGDFWTSSVDAGDPTSVWLVSFQSGRPSRTSPVGYLTYFRCVR